MRPLKSNPALSVLSDLSVKEKSCFVYLPYSQKKKKKTHFCVQANAHFTLREEEKKKKKTTKKKKRKHIWK
jgi:hypothetical protein